MTLDNQNKMIAFEKLFNGFNAKTDIQEFNIHERVSLLSDVSQEEEYQVSEDNENNALMVDHEALLREAGFEPSVNLLAVDPETGEEIPETHVIPPISGGQRNIVKRARQLHEIEWTPLEDIESWGRRTIFKAGETVHGLPYGQPVNVPGYVGYNISLENYAKATLDNTSKFYTTYSSFNKQAPTYSTDCSGFVSYAWQLPSRCTTYSIPNKKISKLVGDQSIYSIELGDCLDQTTSHVVLVSDVTYDAEGKVDGIEILEQTPPKTKLTRYGKGGTKSLASLQSYYLDRGYQIYRRNDRESVQYNPSPVVPLDGETDTLAKAPKVHVTPMVGSKTVELRSDIPGAVIHYTIDGSEPSAASPVYSGAITFNKTTPLKAIAVSGSYPQSAVLRYTVKLNPALQPKAEVVSGLKRDNLVSAGSTVKLTSDTSNSVIRYTLDGSDPAVNGTVYSSPITINADTTIRATAEKAGYLVSPVSELNLKIGKVYTVNLEAQQGGSISPNGATKVLEGSNLTIKATAKIGYKIQSLIVDGADKGAVATYTISNINENHTVTAKFKASSTLPFNDVSSDQWFYEAINFVHKNNLFKGTSEYEFSPGVQMSRGMFVTVLGRFGNVTNYENTPNITVGVVTATGVNVRQGPSTNTAVVGFVQNKNTVVEVLGQENNWYKIKHGTAIGYIRNDLMTAYNNSYSDLNKNMYYSPYVQWAQALGISKNIAGSRFNADVSITREDMCVLLYNYANKYGKILPDLNAKASFTDDYNISSYAKEAVYELQKAGVINGMGDGTFNPKGTAQRCQVAQMFMKFSKL